MSDEIPAKRITRKEVEAYLGFELDEMPDDADWGQLLNDYKQQEIDWSKVSFSDLEKASEDHHKKPADFTPRSEALFNRWCDINRFLCEGDEIWPPIRQGAFYYAATAALAEVLARLPEGAFERATEHIIFVIQHPEVLAVNAPFRRRLPATASSQGGATISLDTIVLFEPCLKFSPAGLIGLIAHEIAHSFVEGTDYKADEKLADELAEKWGFGKELAARTEEKKQFQTRQHAN